MFDSLRQVILPSLAETALELGDSELRCWSLGCASGEEVYTLSLIWQFELKTRFPDLVLQLVATDADPPLLQRAQRGCYPASSVKELPSLWRGHAFVRIGEDYRLREEFRMGIEFRCQDIRREQPEESFQLILCRNLVLTRVTQWESFGGGITIPTSNRERVSERSYMSERSRRISNAINAITGKEFLSANDKKVAR